MYITRAREGRTHEATDIVMALWNSGYAATDIIQTLFRVRVGSCDGFDWFDGLVCLVARLVCVG